MSTDVRHLEVDTPLGRYTIAAKGSAIIGIWREGQKHFPAADRLGEHAQLGKQARLGEHAQLGERLNATQRTGTAAAEGPAAARDPATALAPTDPLLSRAAGQLLAYLRGESTGFNLPLAPQGSDFQQRVWARLQEIPRGQTTTYGQIAHDLGLPRAAQAVGGAVGANPISIVIPCHRVLGARGAITGYAGGTETKLALLRLEGATAGPTQAAPLP